MGHLLQVQILNNNKSHEDLSFSVKGLTEELHLDTYYFDDYNVSNDFQGLKNAIAKLFEYWLTKTKELKQREIIYLPIDFSDQYTGCLKVEKSVETFFLTYGHSRKEGWSVNPIAPDNYCFEVTDFNDNVGRTIEISTNDFINSISFQIAKLKNAS